MATLKAQHLAKSYKGRQVVRDVSLSIDSGQIVGLLGPNGAGKTTCFYMIVGLVQADQGRVMIDDLDVSHQPMHGRARAGIGYLPQEASIFRKLSVADNIMAILETRKDLDGAARRKELEGLLQEFHISHIRDNLGMSLSGGERRRVEIARALLHQPRLLEVQECADAGQQYHKQSDAQQIGRAQDGGGAGKRVATQWPRVLVFGLHRNRLACSPALQLPSLRRKPTSSWSAWPMKSVANKPPTCGF